MLTHNLKILFASNDSIALPVAETINPFGVLTVSSHESGRKKRENPISSWAIKNDKKVYSVSHLMSEEREMIQNEGYDMLISFSFSRIFGPKFLSIFKKGCFNIHPSSLPKYRGPSPLQNALLNGDETTEVTMQTIALKMDEGDIVARKTIKIDKSDDYKSLSQKASQTAIDVVKYFFNSYPNIVYSPQIGDASYTSLIPKTEGLISFNDGGEVIERKIKAYSEYPRMRCLFDDKILILQKASFEKEGHDYPFGTVVSLNKNKGLQIAVKNGFLYVYELQKEGKGLMDALSFVNGNKNIINCTLKECSI